jgi:apolipoprotein N-acyltransferase
MYAALGSTTRHSRAKSALPSRSLRRLSAPPPVAQASALRVYLASILSGGAVSVAWWFPGTVASALLGWAAALLLIYAVRARRAYLPSYCAGLACCSLGFYWVYSTVARFGDFGAFFAALAFGGFVVLSAVQFLLFAFVHHNLGSRCDAWALRSPIALVVSELIAIRVFHWHFGHTQVAFTPFVQVAGIGGAMLVSFLMFWIAEVCVRTVVFRERRWTFLLPLSLGGAALVYGLAMIQIFASAKGATQDVVLVQGNAGLPMKLDADDVGRNVGRLYSLSESAPHQRALIIWPEGAIPAFIPADLGSARKEPGLPWFGDGSAFLVGAYAVDRDDRRYNTAFAVHPDGTVPWPYFKQVLIPFGEYMPLASVLPWLNSLNTKAGIFSAGPGVRVFAYPMRRKDGTAYTLKVSPLICYEDTVPAIARAATAAGAQLLVNLTYDTWFGRSAASSEHHLIAAFRAIENRRFLVRVTNDGLSAVVDPLGRTIARIPPFTEGTALARVSLLDYRSTYTQYVQERPWWALLVLTAGSIAVGRWPSRGRAGRVRTVEA